MKHVLIVIALAWAGAPAQKAPVDFSGVYKPSPLLSKALTESKGLEWRVGGVGSGDSISPQQLAEAAVATVTITQTATHLTIDNRLDAYHTRASLALDGSESVNVNGIRTEKSRTTWKESHLVTTGVRYLELPSREIQRPFTTTRILAPDGNIHIENRAHNPEQNTETVQWSVLVRQKTP